MSLQNLQDVIEEKAIALRRLHYLSKSDKFVETYNAADLNAVEELNKLVASIVVPDCNAWHEEHKVVAAIGDKSTAELRKLAKTYGKKYVNDCNRSQLISYINQSKAEYEKAKATVEKADHQGVDDLRH